MLVPICHFSSSGPVEPNLVLWLDFSDSSLLTLSGSNILQARDKSGNGNHANALLASSPTVATAVQNGLNGAAFTTSKFMSLTNTIDLTSGGRYTAMFIFKSAEVAFNNDCYVMGYSGDTSSFIFWRKGFGGNIYGSGNGGYTNFGSVITETSYNNICMSSDNTPSNTVNFHFNNSAGYPRIEPFNNPGTIPRWNQINRLGTTVFSAMTLCEIKIWSVVLDSTERTSQYNTLKSKWNTP